MNDTMDWTEERIDALAPGRELDVLIATKIMKRKAAFMKGDPCAWDSDQKPIMWSPNDWLLEDYDPAKDGIALPSHLYNPRIVFHYSTYDSGMTRVMDYLRAGIGLESMSLVYAAARARLVVHDPVDPEGAQRGQGHGGDRFGPGARADGRVPGRAQGDSAVTTGGRIGMLGLLAVALNLEGWRGPVVFLMVAVAAIVVFTRLLEWGSNRIKARAGRKAIAPAEPKEYSSYEERRAALSEGENLDDWLDRVRVTPEDRKIKPHSRYWIYKAGAHPDVLFSYYRTNPGGRLLRHVSTASQGFANFETETPHKMVCRSFEGLSIAVPTSGEWWAKANCSKHPAVTEPRIVTKEDGWFFDPAPNRGPALRMPGAGELREGTSQAPTGSRRPPPAAGDPGREAGGQPLRGQSGSRRRDAQEHQDRHQGVLQGT